jgi:hypothetical protein
MGCKGQSVYDFLRAICHSGPAGDSNRHWRNEYSADEMGPDMVDCGTCRCEGQRTKRISGCASTGDRLSGLCLLVLVAENYSACELTTNRTQS